MGGAIGGDPCICHRGDVVFVAGQPLSIELDARRDEARAAGDRRLEPGGSGRALDDRIFFFDLDRSQRAARIEFVVHDKGRCSGRRNIGLFVGFRFFVQGFFDLRCGLGQERVEVA
jgi:hypothetical protein